MLAFIHYYTLVIGCPPAQSDIQRRFAITGPAVHQMLSTLEKKGLLERIPDASRAIRVKLEVGQLPPLRELPGSPLAGAQRTWCRR
ncbi:MarR family transcriptional regulator [bacterium CPR1]|nr:MarR family transcriptional regulator [bacterium CPR1]